MNRNRIIRPVAALAAAALAVALGTTGLAVAGVDLPDPAAEAFENAGITLPNQAGGGESGDHARSDEVRSVIEGTDPSDRGCEFGQSVAAAASGKAPSEHACGQDAEDRKAAKSENSSHSDFGRETAERAKGQKDATVEERKSFGQDTAERAGEQGSAPNGAEQRGETPAAGGTTGAPEGTPGGPPEGTPNGPDTAPIPEDTPNGPPEGTPSGRP
jgi:hypothetical protein